MGSRRFLRSVSSERDRLGAYAAVVVHEQLNLVGLAFERGRKGDVDAATRAGREYAAVICLAVFAYLPSKVAGDIHSCNGYVSRAYVRDCQCKRWTGRAYFLIAEVQR